jgi:hypothetical protein
MSRCSISLEAGSHMRLTPSYPLREKGLRRQAWHDVQSAASTTLPAQHMLEAAVQGSGDVQDAWAGALR